MQDLCLLLNKNAILKFHTGSTTSENDTTDNKDEDFDENLLSDDETRNDIELTNIFTKDGNSAEIANK